MLRTGLGGAIGDIVDHSPVALLDLPLNSFLAHLITGLFFAWCGVVFVFHACNFREGELHAMGRIFGEAGVETGTRIWGSSVPLCVVYRRPHSAHAG